MKADLHLHTTASDGTYTPSRLLRKLEKLHITWAGITDHDTMSGIDEAMIAGKRCGVRVIPGVELSADAGAEVHVLGYGVERTEEALFTMETLKREREERMRLMVSKLCGVGLEITEEEVLGLTQGIAGRVHVARILVQKKYVPSIKEAFHRYLVPGKAGYEKRKKMSARDAVRWIKNQGGIAVLAHPGLIELSESDVNKIIKSLMEEGLSGVEAYHPGHTNRQCAHFDGQARRLSLLVTGGSDFHGDNKSFEPGFRLDRWKKMDDDLRDLFHKLPIRE